ncbi:phage minor head protein [Helicobacter winghamensis]|uniref:phage minor head protein n=1 Tax=Helicobacter winghamensis TaxID=157268 RepID=UPI0001A28386|nr:phage minor head protein [Helicobacter winghamensis]EEO26026.1 phage protein F-like protein [Helicobacter winghamensis ATCC BAA-430]
MNNVFGLSPKEAYSYLENKGLKTSFKYHEIKKEAHDKAFTAAGIMKTDVLNDLHEEIKKAIKEGISFDEFKGNLKAILSSKGWYGKKEIINPKTGEIRTININPQRLKTIYTTNMQSAYAKARAKQLSTYSYKTYWVYKCALLEDSRSEHKKMHNCAIHRDDPFWRTSFPPNDYNCKCKVIAVSEKEAKSKYKILKNPRPIASKNFSYDKRSSTQIPKETRISLDESLEHLPKVQSYDNLSDKQLIAKVYEAFGVKQGDLLVDKIGDVISLDDDFFFDKKKQTTKIKKQNRHFYIDYLPKLVNDPDEIRLSMENDPRYEGFTYIINYANQLMVKLLQLNPFDNILEIISVNKDYKSYQLHISETQELMLIKGRVLRAII